MDTNAETYTSDIVELLKEELGARKQRNSHYSLRAFALDLKVSPAQLSQLISGKRNFTPNIIRQISQALLLSPEVETRLLTQTVMPKNVHLKGELKKRQLQEDEFRIIADWYHFAILSLSKIKNAKADPFWVSDRLGISVAEARDALDRLMRIGFLENSKLLKRLSAPLNFESKDPSRAIQRYHTNILKMALEKLPETELERRDYSAMTFLADAKKVPQARKMIESFQDELSSFLHTPNAKEVFVVSCQVFPLKRNRK